MRDEGLQGLKDALRTGTSPTKFKLECANKEFFACTTKQLTLSSYNR